MKKILFLALAVPSIVILAGCAQKQTNQGLNKQENKPEQAEQKSEETLTSIMQAVNSGKKMACTYETKMEDETFSSKTFIDGKRFKIESEIEGNNDYVLYDGETIYSWTDLDKEGTKMSLSCISELNKQLGNGEEFAGEGISSAEEALKDAVNIKCEEISEIDFSVPSDVVFEDECQTMKEELNSSNASTDKKL
jgi:hypothetical protein